MKLDIFKGIIEMSNFYDLFNTVGNSGSREEKGSLRINSIYQPPPKKKPKEVKET